MNEKLADWLVDPADRAPLTLHVEQRSETGEILTGTLTDVAGAAYPIQGGIPRFVTTQDDAQRQTQQSFGYKWAKRQSYESPASLDRARSWLVRRFGFRDADDMRGYFASRRSIVDAGCGAGFSSSTWMDAAWPESAATEWIGVDISTAVDVARLRLGTRPRTHFVQADLMELPFADGFADTAFCEGALHHTPSTERALRSVARVLESGGELLFYVYRKKAPCREFSDDHVRQQISDLPPEEAWQQLRGLTLLGKALAELKTDVTVPEDVPVLGIKAGRYDVQRLVYWHFAKMFWDESLGMEENQHVNFDWYHPKYAHRQTEAELRRWCEGAGLSISRFHAEESGFSVRAIKA